MCAVRGYGFVWPIGEQCEGSFDCLGQVVEVGWWCMDCEDGSVARILEACVAMSYRDGVVRL